MADWRYGGTDWTGVRRDWRPDGNGGIELRMSQDVEAALDRNKAARNHNDGYTPSREMRRVATIPPMVALKWLHEEGWWYADPQNADRLLKKLMDPDWAHLRTADGRLALDNGVIR
jgi:hypothetical protein